MVKKDPFASLFDLQPRADAKTSTKSTRHLPIMAQVQHLEFREAPVSDASPICVDPALPCVVHTPFLKWRPAPAGPAGAARVCLYSSEWLAAFGGKLRAGPAPADRAAASLVNVLTLRLSEDRVRRWMATLQAANIFSAAHNMRKIKDLHRVIRTTTIPPTEADVVAGDYSEGAQFIIPQGQGAQAQQVRALLQPIRFIGMATVALLEQPRETMPWSAVAALQGILGACFTVASRTDELSQVQTFAAYFRHFHSECTSDATLARTLRNIEGDIRLPSSMEPVSADTEELYSAAVDGIDYHNLTRRDQIEERRIRLLLSEVCACDCSSCHDDRLSRPS